MNSINKVIIELRKDKNFTPILIYILLLISVLANSLALSLILTSFLFLSLITYKNPILGFYLGVFSLSFDQIFITTSFSLKIHMLVFLAVFLALIYDSIKKRKLPVLPPKPLVIALLVLYFFSVISIIFAVDKIITARFLGSLLYSFAVFTITFIFISDKDKAIKSVLALFVGALASAIVSIYQFIAFYFNISFFRKVNILNPGNFVRPKGLFDHTNFLANYFIVAIPIILTYTFWEKSKSFIKYFFIALTVVALAITLSRAGYIGFGVSIIIILYFAIKYGKIRITVLRGFRIASIALSILAILFFVIGPLKLDFSPTEKSITDESQKELLVDRVGSSVDLEAVTNIERIQIWIAGVEMLKDNWLTGVGLENFETRYSEYQLEGVKRITNAHNSYFQLWIEVGIFGFLAFLGFLTLLIRYSLNGIRETKDETLKALGIGAIAALIGLTIQNLTISVFYYAHTWFLYGFIVAVAHLSIKKK